MSYCFRIPSLTLGCKELEIEDLASSSFCFQVLMSWSEPNVLAGAKRKHGVGHEAKNPRFNSLPVMNIMGRMQMKILTKDLDAFSILRDRGVCQLSRCLGLFRQ